MTSISMSYNHSFLFHFYLNISFYYYIGLITLCCVNYCSSSHLTSSSSKDWTLKTISNPNCGDYKSCSKLGEKTDLIYTQSCRLNSSIHFLTSTLGGFPGLLITRTSSADALKVNWDSLLGNCGGSLDFSVLPEDSIGIVLKSFLDLDTKDIHWTLGNNRSLDCDSERCSFGYDALPGESSINQTISINLEIRNILSLFADFPHLTLTPSSMHIDVQIRNVDKSQIDKSGGVELLIVTSGNAFDDKYERSVDDENSPGIFTKQSFIFSKENASESISYIQWKPVAYNSNDRIMSKTMKIDSSNLTDSGLNPMLNRPVYCFYKETKTIYSAYTLKVTFIQDADASSQMIDLISWSLVFGLNSPPTEKLSTLLQLIIYAGVGSSFCVMVISLIYVTIKKWQISTLRREPGLINEVIIDY